MPKRPPIPKEVLVPGAEPPATTPAPNAADNSLRLHVRKLVLDGVVERPAYGIHVAELNALLEKMLAAHLGAQGEAEGRRGSSDKEIPVSVDQLKSLIEQEQGGNEAVTAEAVKSLIDKLQAGQDRRGLSIAELQEIAAEVARYYRRRGLILTQAYIPPQSIDDGVVTIRVIEGTLGQVMVENPRSYRIAQLTQPFREMIGKPVSQQAAEEALLLLSDYPGLEIFAVFKPGSAVGTTDMLLSVLDEERIALRLHGDNYGSQYTGEYRTRLDLRVNNPFRSQGRLSAHVSKTYSPTKGLYGGLGYERMAFGPRNIFGMSYRSNAYELGGALAPFGITGTTQIGDIYWRRTFTRSRLQNSYALFKFARKSVKLDVTEGEDTADELSVLSAEYGLDWRSSTGRAFQASWLQLSQGFEGMLGAMRATDDPDATSANRRGGSGQYAGGEFTKLAADYQYWYNLNATHTLRLAAQAQYSPNLLTSIEQFSLGGPNSVRAFANGEYLADTGYSLSVEWLLRAPGFANWPALGGKRWGDILQFVVFADTGQGQLNDPLASDRKELSLSGAGAGVRLNSNKFSARFEVATPLGKETASNGRDPQYFFEFNYGF